MNTRQLNYLPIVLGVLLCIEPSVGLAINEVRLEVRAEDGHGKDSLFAGCPGKVHIVASADTSVYGIVYCFAITSLLGPDANYQPISSGDTSWSNLARQFSLNRIYVTHQDGLSPDSFVLALVQPGTGLIEVGQDRELGYFFITPEAAGSLIFDTTEWGMGNITTIGTKTDYDLVSITVRDSLSFQFPSVTVINSPDLDGDGLGDACDSCTLVPGDCTPCCQLPGDADDGGDTSIGDAVFIVKFILQGGDTPPCLDQADADGGGDVNIADAVYIVKFAFVPGSPDPVCGTSGS